jgi:putative copper resistance protein D
MSLLVDLFGYLSIIIHGFTIVAQSMAIGGVLFLVFLSAPLSKALGLAGPRILADTARIAAWAAIGLMVAEAATVALQAAILVGTVDLSLLDALGASSAVAGMIKIVTGAIIAIAMFGGGASAPRVLLLAASLVELIAATLTTHAAARLDDRGILLAAAFLHQLGAAVWIGGIPTFIMALARVHDANAWRILGHRFGQMSQVGVGCIVVSAAIFSILYIGAPDAVYGTAYGVMAGAKAVMFVALLGLGWGNSRVTARLRSDPNAPVLRMKRFAEIEIGIGFSLFFAAASLTSVPPSVDLTTDRVTWAEVVERNALVWPNMHSPEHDVLALPALQAKLDAEAAIEAAKPQPAFIPGGGELPVRNAADIGWSEYNHHWAGVFVVLIGLLALLNQAGLRIARHWPLLFLGLAVFLFLRSDPEVWPLGEEGIFESLRDIEVLQHRFFVLLTVFFAIFEWRVRAGGWANKKAALVFPVATLLGGAALLTHSHAIANVKEALLIELTHTPLALAAIFAGSARWLELRLPGRGGRVAGWVWPVLFVFIGLLLLGYREH